MYVRDGVLFSPANIGPYLTPNQVVTIHDASVFAIPHVYLKTFRLKYQVILDRLCKTAKKVITVSEFSRKELIKYCDVDPQNVVVIPHGHEHLNDIKEDGSIIQEHDLNAQPYYLAVGSQSAHKNLKVIMEAMNLITDPDFRLIITGGIFDNIFHNEKIKMHHNVIHVGYVSDGQLCSLYKHSRAIIFPSLYEGFGLAVLEALSLGCQVICSNAASLPEVGGNVVTFFNPDDARGLANILSNFSPTIDVWSMDEWVAKFTWKSSVNRTWHILYDECLDKI